MHIAPGAAFYKPTGVIFTVPTIHSENWFPRVEIML
jgi:hypothetical protein